MKITKTQLKKIIKEELEAILSEDEEAKTCKKECQKEHKKRLLSLEDCHQDSECTRRREKAFEAMKKKLDKCNKGCKEQ
tara:strand:+ start:49 stop:285 length:237 start_codon:yes stop_codon:yes gene_type:complete